MSTTISSTPTTDHDVLIVGGGPAGLGAALALGRATKRVLLCDGGTRRNAAAEHMHGFVTRDGIPPSEFRRIAREQLRPYDVAIKDVGVTDITSTPTASPNHQTFQVRLADGTHLTTRRVLLALGLVDELPDLPGLPELWGHSVFSCPYCHGWELRDRPWGVLVSDPSHLDFAIFATGWTKDVVAFTNGPLAIDAPVRARLERAGVRLEHRPIRRLVAGPDRRLTGVELTDGTIIPRHALVLRPSQRQPDLVRRIGVALDDRRLVRVDPTTGQTSIPGVYAAGDLADPGQAAIFAAAAGTRAAYQLNHAMNVDL